MKGYFFVPWFYYLITFPFLANDASIIEPQNATSSNIEIFKTILSVPSELNDCRKRDSLVIASLYEHADGDNWDVNWNLDDPMEQWWEGIDAGGVQINSEGCVYHIELNGKRLNGDLPDSIGLLSELIYFSITSNNLTGTIPKSIANLSKLEELWLLENNFEGEIPIELGNLTTLTHLSLADNELTGPIPATFGNLNSLKYLWLYNNKLSGNLPEELGNLTNLEILALSINQFTGEVPDSYSNLILLKEFWLADNELSGNFPNWVSTLLNLEVLSIGNNNFSGELPPNLGNLPYLRRIYLNNNKFTGEFPSSYVAFCNLDLSTNELEFGYNFLGNPNLLYEGDFDLFCLIEGNLNCSQRDSLILTRFYESTNGSNWTIPWDTLKPVNSWYGVELDEEGCVKSLNLNNNNLKGRVPLALSGLAKIEYLSLNNNRLYGDFPSPIFDLKNLKVLDLSNNDLTGPISDNWSNLPELTFLNLSSNFFTGEIPKSLGSLIKIISLNLLSNGFSGGIPSEIGNLIELEYLGLGEGIGGAPNVSQLEGSIPQSFINLKKLKNLTINYTHINGGIPDLIGELDSMQILWLSNNKLTGAVPDGVGSLPNLKYFDVSENMLSGEIPSSFTERILKQFFISENQFSFVPRLNTNELEEFNVCENQLTFESIVENLNSLPADAQFCYAPQDSILVDTVITINEGESWAISLGIDEEITSNTYNWFQNEQFFTSTSENILSFSSAEKKHEGFYVTNVENTNAPFLTLYSRVVEVIFVPDCNNIVANIGNDTTLCLGSSIDLQLNIDDCEGCTYQWSNGSILPSIRVSPDTSTTFGLEVESQNGCKIYDEINIEVLPKPIFEIQKNDPDCKNPTGSAQVVINGANSEYFIEWSNGVKNQNFISNLRSGQYGVTVEDSNGCKAVDNFTIQQSSNDTIILRDSLCKNEQYQLAGNIYDEPGNYTIDLKTNEGCDSIINLILTRKTEFQIDIDTSICSGDTIIINEIAYTNEGTYTQNISYIEDPSCDSLIINIEIKELDQNLPTDLIELEEQTTCMPSLFLQAILPIGFEGFWFSQNNAEILSPFLSETEIVNLQQGENLFTWTVSNKNCDSFQSDSIIILYTPGIQPVANNDKFIFQESSPNIEGNVVINDLVEDLNNYSIRLLEIIGDFDIDLMSDGRFEADLPEQFERGEFTYLLINEECPDLIDTGLVELIIEDVSVLPKYYGMTIGEASTENNIFRIPNFEIYENVSVYIFSRWDGLIYENEDYENDWDGKTKNGNYIPAGEYIYRVIIQQKDKQKKELLGKIVVIK